MTYVHSTLATGSHAVLPHHHYTHMHYLVTTPPPASGAGEPANHAADHLYGSIHTKHGASSPLASLSCAVVGAGAQQTHSLPCSLLSLWHVLPAAQPAPGGTEEIQGVVYTTTYVYIILVQ